MSDPKNLTTKMSMLVIRFFLAFFFLSTVAIQAAPTPKEEPKAKITLEGVASDGAKLKPDEKAIKSGAEAVTKVLTTCNATDFFDDKTKPFEKDAWADWTTNWLRGNRPHVWLKFDKPQTIEFSLNGEKKKVVISEIIFAGSHSGSASPCLFAAGAGKYYFANQLDKDEVKKMTAWLEKVSEKR